MFEFAALPPEVNSGRMYTGPGAGPMLAAAAAWDGLAAELYGTASSYASEVSGLTDGLWTGPSATAMGNAATLQVDWLSTTAAQAERAANQARAAAGAYEAAFAMTVPPPVIAANRALLAVLVATNFFGQNTPAIAATEAHYAEMWAQDAGAMYGYAAASAVSSVLDPFAPPPRNSDGGANQGAAVAQAGSSAANQTQTLLSIGPQVLSSGPPALQGLASPWAAASGGAQSLVEIIQTLIALGPPPIVSEFSPIIQNISGWGVLIAAWIEFPMTEMIFGGMLGWPATATMSPLAAEELPMAGSEIAAEEELFTGMGGMPAMFGATPLVAMANNGKQGKDSVDEPETPASGKRQRAP